MALLPFNLVKNGSFEEWTSGLGPDYWSVMGNPSILDKVVGEKDNFGSNAVRIITAVADEGIQFVISKLKGGVDGTVYTVTAKVKVADGSTAKLWTIGGSTDLNLTSTSTSWVTITGTFTTTPAGGDVTLRIGSPYGGYTVLFDSIIVNEGNTSYDFAPNPVDYATAAPTANKIPKADANGKLALGWLPTNVSDANVNLIYGCRPKYNSSSTIDITPGQIIISGFLAKRTSVLSLTFSNVEGYPANLTENRWYYVYLVKPAADGGEYTGKISITAPSTSTTGGARYHSSQPNWRYVGSIYHQTGLNVLNVMPFRRMGNWIEYTDRTIQAMLTVSANWSYTSIPAGGIDAFVPKTASGIRLWLQNWCYDRWSLRHFVAGDADNGTTTARNEKEFYVTGPAGYFLSMSSTEYDVAIISDASPMKLWHRGVLVGTTGGAGYPKYAITARGYYEEA